MNHHHAVPWSPHALASAAPRVERARYAPRRGPRRCLSYPVLVASRPLSLSEPDPDEERDARALETLFRAEYRELSALVRRYVRSRAVAEEIIQDTFLAIWRRRRRWGTTEDLRGYIYATARNRALNHLRRQRIEVNWQRLSAAREDEWGVSQFTSDTGQLTEVDEMIEKMRRAVAALPARARRTLLLRLQWHLTNAEVAEVMGISVKAVERNIGRGLKALRAAFAEER